MKNPSKNILKLRQTAGAEQVTVNSSFTQFTPITSYSLGSSTVSVNLTVNEWPISGQGIINTSRVDDFFGTQMFQPFGTSRSMQRRWDQTAIDFSDTFIGTNGDTYDHNKWAEAVGGLTAPYHSSSYGGTMYLITQGPSNIFNGLIGKFYLPGDFDIQSVLYKDGAGGGSGMYLGPKASINTAVGSPTSNWQDLTSMYAYGSSGWESHIAGTISYIEAATTSQPFYIRVVRVGNQVTTYYRNVETDPWIQAGTGNQPASWLTNNVYVKFSGSTGNAFTNYGYHVGNFIVNSPGIGTIIVSETAAQSHWSDWLEVSGVAGPAGASGTIIPTQAVAPVSPAIDSLWIDTSVSTSPALKMWTSSGWIAVV